MNGCRRRRKDLVLYHYGALEGSARDRLVSHLESCRACRGAIDEIATLGRTLSVHSEKEHPAGSPDPLEGFRDEVMRRIEALPQPQSAGRPRFLWASAVGVAAAALLLLVLVSSDRGPSGSHPANGVLRGEELELLEELELIEDMDLLENWELVELLDQV